MYIYVFMYIYIYVYIYTYPHIYIGLACVRKVRTSRVQGYSAGSHYKGQYLSSYTQQALTPV